MHQTALDGVGETLLGHPIWRDRQGDVEVCFIGRAASGPSAEANALLAALAPPRAQLSRLRQIHSATVLDAEVGSCGEGDALVSDRPDLALAVVTADCVPVLLAGGGWIAAVHAGWRGLVGGILKATVRRLPATAGELTAWVGPAIGPCCYEVGEEVARQIAEASSPAVLRSSPGSRPHADLIAAARWQLAELGVGTVRTLPLCTRCEEERLWSYRRDGARERTPEGDRPGRNWAFVWRRR